MWDIFIYGIEMYSQPASQQQIEKKGKMFRILWCYDLNWGRPANLKIVHRETWPDRYQYGGHLEQNRAANGLDKIKFDNCKNVSKTHTNKHIDLSIVRSIHLSYCLSVYERKEKKL